MGIIVSLLIILLMILVSFCALGLIFVMFLIIATVFYEIGQGLNFLFEVIEENKIYKKIEKYFYKKQLSKFDLKFTQYKKLVFKVMYIVLYILAVVIVVYVFCKLINLVDFKLIFEKIKTS